MLLAQDRPQQVLDAGKFLFDMLIVGAGGAGMNLLLALMKSGYTQNHKVGVIEPFDKDSNDRTWCFWAQPTDDIVIDLDEVISASWTNMLVNGVEKKSIDPFRYYHIKSQDFYQYVKKQMQDRGVEWIKDEIEFIEQRTGKAILHGKNESYFTQRIFDSRLNADQVEALKNENNMLWQSFYGYKIRLSEGIFDPDAMTMMSFDVEQSGGTQFMYVLPYNEKEALIELTRFSPQLINLDRSAQIMDKWIRGHYGPYTLIETELGRIPMTDQLENHSAGVEQDRVPIGTAAGAVKSSTGYAFKRMYKHAHEIARSLKYDLPIPSVSSRKRSTFYDRILLHLLKEQPEKGKLIFTRLFKKVIPQKVLRFLDEETTLAEELAILATLPFGLFSKAFLDVYILKRFKS